MNIQEARRLVQLGLDHRKEEQNKAKQEAKLEAYERDMITACNDNCATARNLRLLDETNRYNREMLAAQRKEQQEQYAELRRLERERLQKEIEQNFAAQDTVRGFVFFCLVTALITVWTPFPWWAAIALVVGIGACAGAYVFRVYFPAEEE